MNRSLQLTTVFMLMYSFSLNAASFDATVHWAKKTNLSVPVSGKVLEIYVNPGQEVKKDQVILKFDQTLFKAAVDQAEAQVTSSRTLRKAAKREFEQAKELYARTILSTVSLEEAREKNQRAQADYKTALAKLSVARYQFQQSTLVAPFNGWILDILVSVGQTLANELDSKPLVVMAEKGLYIARGSLPLKKISPLKIGDTVGVEVGGKEIDGKINSIGLEPLPGKEKQNYMIEVLFKLDGPVLRAGERVGIEIR